MSRNAPAGAEGPLGRQLAEQWKGQPVIPHLDAGDPAGYHETLEDGVNVEPGSRAAVKPLLPALPAAAMARQLPVTEAAAPATTDLLELADLLAQPLFRRLLAGEALEVQGARYFLVAQTAEVQPAAAKVQPTAEMQPALHRVTRPPAVLPAPVHLQTTEQAAETSPTPAPARGSAPTRTAPSRTAPVSPAPAVPVNPASRPGTVDLLDAQGVTCGRVVTGNLSASGQGRGPTRMAVELDDGPLHEHLTLARPLGLGPYKVKEKRDGNWFILGSLDDRGLKLKLADPPNTRKLTAWN